MDVFGGGVYLGSNCTWKIALSLWKQLKILAVFSYVSKGHIPYMQLFFSLERALTVIHLVCSKPYLAQAVTLPSYCSSTTLSAEPQTCNAGRVQMNQNISIHQQKKKVTFIHQSFVPWRNHRQGLFRFLSLVKLAWIPTIPWVFLDPSLATCPSKWSKRDQVLL